MKTGSNTGFVFRWAAIFAILLIFTTYMFSSYRLFREPQNNVDALSANSAAQNDIVKFKPLTNNSLLTRLTYAYQPDKVCYVSDSQLQHISQLNKTATAINDSNGSKVLDLTSYNISGNQPLNSYLNHQTNCQNDSQPWFAVPVNGIS